MTNRQAAAALTALAAEPLPWLQKGTPVVWAESGSTLRAVVTRRTAEAATVALTAVAPGLWYAHAGKKYTWLLGVIEGFCDHPTVRFREDEP